MPMSNFEVGLKIMDARKQNNMSQKEFANKVNISQQTLSRYEKGDAQVPYDVIEKIAEILNVPVHYLLGIKVDGMDDKELLLIEFYRRVDDRLKGRVLDVVKVLSEEF